MIFLISCPTREILCNTAEVCYCGLVTIFQRVVSDQLRTLASEHPVAPASIEPKVCVSNKTFTKSTTVSIEHLVELKLLKRVKRFTYPFNAGVSACMCDIASVRGMPLVDKRGRNLSFAPHLFPPLVSSGAWRWSPEPSPLSSHPYCDCAPPHRASGGGGGRRRRWSLSTMRTGGARRSQSVYIMNSTLAGRGNGYLFPSGGPNLQRFTCVCSSHARRV